MIPHLANMMHANSDVTGLLGENCCFLLNCQEFNFFFFALLMYTFILVAPYSLLFCWSIPNSNLIGSSLQKHQFGRLDMCDSSENTKVTFRLKSNFIFSMSNNVNISKITRMLLLGFFIIMLDLCVYWDL